jgi:hypothetical protein
VDQLITSYNGLVDGRLNVRADGGAGNDIVRTDVTLADGSDGAVRARVMGGKGDDALRLFVTEPAVGTVTVDAVLDGGAGTDTADASANVTVQNVP